MTNRRTLRELAKEHAQGNLDKDAYRKSRAELLQGIIDSTIPVEEVDFPPLVQPPEPENLDVTQRRDENKRTTSDPDATTSPKSRAKGDAQNNTGDAPGSSNRILFIALALGLVGVIVAGVFMLKGGDEQASQSMNKAGEPGEISSPSLSKAEILVQGFLKNKNWSSSSLTAFEYQWAELSGEDKEGSKNSLALGQLTNAIYKQLLEEQALSGLVEDDSSLDKQRRLVEFAEHLGIQDSRIALPEEAVDTIDTTMDALQP